MPHAPIALFCFNRPEHLAKTLDSLSQAHGLRQSVIHAFCDGPRNDADQDGVAAVRALLRQRSATLPIVLHEKQANLGLQQSIVQGVTELVETQGRAIVLEDDILVSPHFLSFMNDALDRYADEPKVMHIAAYFPPTPVEGLPQCFFYRPASCWGWATWAESWRHLQLDAASLLSRLEGEAGHAFNLEGAYGFLNHLKLNLQGRINTWAIFWYASVYLRGGLCLHPARSLAWNIGHDGSGANCKGTSVFDVELAQEPVTRFPEELRECPEALARARAFFLAHTSVSRQEA
ncbi:sugar transferase [Humidesulfovibrio sp.]